MRCDLTWQGLPVLASDFVDFLVAQSDEFERSSEEIWEPSCHNPFTVFPANGWTYGPSAPTMIKSLSVDVSSSPQERLLLHHYVTYVARLMIPFEDTRNPWLSDYPTLATARSSQEQKALYSAILTHAAFNLAHLHGETAEISLATKHYDDAIALVKTSIANPSRDYGSLQAAIMTLMMAEVCCASESDPWLTC